MNNPKQFAESPSAWRSLPEMSLPSLRGAAEKGAIYSVHKVGFVLASKSACAAAGIQAEPGPGGKCHLPTVVIDFSGSKTLCRLPLSLAPWAFNCVAMSQTGELGFPASVEFGILDGREYAEFLI